MNPTNIKEKQIVVIGVSEREEKYGFKIFRDLIKSGFKVEGINPRGVDVLGRKIYKNLKELPKVPDLVITVVPHEVTERVVDECRELGIKEIWMQPGSESALAIQKAKEYGISVVHNACFMVEKGIW
jgi:predicted CoA-binding protein